MKLIIECAEQTYSECKKISGLSETAYVIAHGIPYNPSGDCISRSALIKKLEEMANNEWNIQVGSSKGLGDAIDVVENAEAVDLWQMRQEATENALKKAEVLYGRPQCEWRNVVHGLLAYKACNKCNAEYPFDLTEDWILCPRCGAEIRKGGVE